MASEYWKWKFKDVQPEEKRELTPEEMERARGHLAVCSGCRAYVDDALAIRAGFPPARFWSRSPAALPGMPCTRSSRIIRLLMWAKTPCPATL